MYERKCPKCDITIKIKNKSYFIRSEQNNTLCRKCSPGNQKKYDISQYCLIRTCLSCNNIITYKRVNDKITADKLNSVCKSCSGKVTGFKKGQKTINTVPYFECWVKKYGIDIANIKKEELRKRASLNFTGDKNPMFGKVAPIGSGNGWSGWYKGWFFRSLLELSYMIKIIERFNIHWQCAEKNISISYTFNGQSRTYRPDFILNDRYLIECKPKKLHTIPINLAKKEAAIVYCKQNNLKYKVVDIRCISDTLIRELYDTRQIKFTDKYERRYHEKFKSDQ